MRSAVCTETGIPTTHRHSGARDSANPEYNDHDRGYGFGLRQVAHPAVMIAEMIWN
jgi:hypothetical protein